MQFKQFYKVFLEKRNFYYTIPVSKEKLLYDFYTIEMLNHYVKKRFNPNRPDLPTAGFDEDDPERVSVKHARDILVPFLKNEMLDAMFISCSCEIRYAIQFLDKIPKSYNPEMSGTEKILNNLLPEHKKIFLYYEKYYNNLVDKYEKALSNPFEVPEVPESLGDRHSPRNNTVMVGGRSYYERISSIKSSIRAAKEYGKPAVVRMFHEMFLQNIWPKNFGGKAWADIAECYLDLSSTTKFDLNRMSVYIDRAYDLQHNTGSVFNKLKTYLGKGAYDWIQNALDYKYSANPWDLSTKSSGVLPRLSKIILARARVEKPPEKEKWSEDYTTLMDMTDAVFVDFVKNDTNLLSYIPYDTEVNNKHYYENVNKSITKDFAEAVIKRSTKIQDTKRAKFIIETLITKFPFKFYTPLADTFLNSTDTVLNKPDYVLYHNVMKIWSAKQLVAAFYKEPDWRTANPQFLKVLENYISSPQTISSFLVKYPTYLNNYGDKFAVHDVITFLTNLQNSGKLPKTEGVDAIIDSYKNSDLYNEDNNIINSYKKSVPNEDQI